MAKMSSTATRSALETPVVALVTVCVASQTVDEITEAVDKMPWAPVHERLEKYPGTESRAHWSTHTKNASACVAVVDMDDDAVAALEAIDFLHRTLPGKVSIIALSTDKDPAMILKTMRAGCSEYLEKPFSQTQFAEALSRLDRRAINTGGGDPTHGRILSFFGAKGGVGTTTLAVHLAVHLASKHHKKTLLIDNHLELGHVCLYLGLDGNQYSFHELLRSVNRLDVDLLKGFVVTHASGMDIIASAEAHGGARSTDPEALQHTLQFLRDEYDYVVLDCTTSLEEANMTVVDLSDQVFLVATPDIGAVRDLSRQIDGLIRYQQPTEKLRIVVNRSGSKGAMSTVQIEKAIRLPISANIPNSYAELAKATNMGVPVSPEEKSDFSAHMREWSREVVGVPSAVVQASAKKRFSFWK
jgi:pilus assembly protein CpaE